MTNEHSLALLYDYDINHDINSFIEITKEYVHLVIICGVIILVLPELSDDPIMLFVFLVKAIIRSNNRETQST